MVVLFKAEASYSSTTKNQARDKQTTYFLDSEVIKSRTTYFLLQLTSRYMKYSIPVHASYV